MMLHPRGMKNYVLNIFAYLTQPGHHFPAVARPRARSPTVVEIDVESSETPFKAVVVRPATLLLIVSTDCVPIRESQTFGRGDARSSRMFRQNCKVCKRQNLSVAMYRHAQH